MLFIIMKSSVQEKRPFLGMYFLGFFYFKIIKEND